MSTKINKTKQTKWKRMDHRTSLYIRMLHKECGLSCCDIVKRFPKYAPRTIYRHAMKDIMDPPDNRKQNPGRPKKLTIRDDRSIHRALKKLRKSSASFTSKKIQEEADLYHVNLKTVQRSLHKMGYRYRQSRKKGLLTPADKRKRVCYARQSLKLPKNFWRDQIVFYFDGVSFAHKYNPYAEARSTSSMTWRQPNEGLQRTTKGRKEGSGGKMACFYVAISYNHGVVLCQQYHWPVVTGERFAKFVRNAFPKTFERCGVSPAGTKWVQDGDPRQISAVSRRAWEKLGCEMFPIPARSPDLNPIENMFHLVRKQLARDALENEIKKESYDEFSKRVSTTLLNFPIDTIKKTIDTMEKRLKLVIKGKGNRTKY